MYLGNNKFRAPSRHIIAYEVARIGFFVVVVAAILLSYKKELLGGATCNGAYYENNKCKRKMLTHNFAYSIICCVYVSAYGLRLKLRAHRVIAAAVIW